MTGAQAGCSCVQQGCPRECLLQRHRTKAKPISEIPLILAEYLLYFDRSGSAVIPLVRAGVS